MKHHAGAEMAMKERLREFDPTGSLQRDCAEIAAIIGGDSDRVANADRKSTRLNSSHNPASRMPSSA
jgi:hypothetical protein